MEIKEKGKPKMKKLTLLLMSALLLVASGLFAQDIEKDVKVEIDDEGNKMVWISEDGEKHELVEDFEFIGQPGMGHGERIMIRKMDCGHECGQCDGRKFKGRKKGRREHGMKRMFHGLDLSDDQKDQIKDMKLKFELAKIDMKADIKKALLVLKSLKQDSDASQREVFSAIDKLANLKAEMQKAQYKQHEAFKSVLTDEQLEKMDGMKKRSAKADREKKIIRKFKGNGGR